MQSYFDINCFIDTGSRHELNLPLNFEMHSNFGVLCLKIQDI